MPLLAFAAWPLAAQPAPENSFLPLRPNGANYVRSYDGSVEIGFVVESARTFENSAVGRVRFENPWTPHSWLVFEDAAGTWLSGFVIDGTEYGFPRPSPLFMKGGTTGSTWSGEITEVTQTGEALTVETPAGRISDASRFRIQFSDGNVQEWTVAPGYGIVAGGPSSEDLLLTESREGTAPETWSPVHSGKEEPCSVAGVSAIPMDPSLNFIRRLAAIVPAVQMGSRFHVSTISWSELEPAPNFVSSQRIVEEVALAAGFGMDVALTIRTIDTSVAHRAPDLGILPWDHPLVVARFVKTVSTLLARLPAQPRWLHLGYEMEPYLIANPGETEPFRRFVAAASAELKKVTNASLGLTFGFDATKARANVFRQLESVCEHVAFDYYALRAQSGYKHIGEEMPDFDVPLMRDLAGNRKMLLTEVGYATHEAVNGGLEKQQRFYEALFAQVAASKGQIAAVNVWSLNDMSESAVNQTLLGYGLAQTGAREFLGSLGIRDSAGSPKPGYETVRSGFSDLHSSASCRP